MGVTKSDLFTEEQNDLAMWQKPLRILLALPLFSIC